MSTERKTFFAEIILPIPLRQSFTYRIPFEMNDLVQVGARVVVPFGKRRILTGVISLIHDKAPEGFAAKYILEVLDDHPLVTREHLKLWAWVADYYMCTPGDVMNAALPSGLKLSSTSHIQLHPDADPDDPKYTFTKQEQKLLDGLRSQQSMTYDEAARLLQVQNIYHVLKGLIKRELVIVYEEVKEKYKPKKIRKVRLNNTYTDSTVLSELLENGLSSAKQEELLMAYLVQVPVIQQPERNEKGIDKSLLMKKGKKKLSDSALKTLIKKGVLEEFEIVISRIDAELENMQDPVFEKEIILTEAQAQASSEIFEHFESKDAVLLHGVTGSGKTEIYMDLIQKVLQSGSQVLFLLPEIALTTQIVARLKKVFGETMGVYHSRFSDNERVEVWRGVREGKLSFVAGVRSSIFLPFQNLGLIIVDEEHDASYKQYDPAPRYHARDLSMVMAKMQHAKVLLGSATPSVESYFLALKGQYGLVSLSKRYGDALMPNFEIVNLLDERKRNAMKQHFSPQLLEGVRNALEQKEQVIVFQNRRGYAPRLECQDCGWIPKCIHCAVSLTYHQHQQELRCHYCGYSERLPEMCHACGSKKVKNVGYGTEKIEEDLVLHFEEARVRRMDRDTTRSKNAYDDIISDFENYNIDILVGTQMISKGLDFGKVNLVCIFDVDRMMHYPDFRAFERTFQLITQVAGRAGRRGDKGKVLIQTTSPEHPILKLASENDYQGFYDKEIHERHVHHYPPFTRVIRLRIRHEDARVSEKAARFITAQLVKKLGRDRVLGPEPPLIFRIRNRYLQDIILKFARDRVKLSKVKTFLLAVIKQAGEQKEFKQAEVIADVDFV